MRLLKGTGSAVTGLAFSPDGGTLAAGAPSRVNLWNVADGTVGVVPLGVWGVPPDGVRFGPSGKWLLAGLGPQRGLLVVDTQTGEGRQVGTLEVNCVAASRTGQVLAGLGRMYRSRSPRAARAAGRGRRP
jgi:hypothetical protein